MAVTTNLLKSELIKCKENPVYFINNYVKREEVGGFEQFGIYQKQEDLVKNYLKDHYLILLKSRQIGISTIIQALSLYQMIFFSDVTIGAVSRDGPEATDFVRKTMLMLDNLPNWLKPKLIKKTQQSFEFANRSRIVSTAINLSNPSATLRGRTITSLIIDEAAFIRFIDAAYTAMTPSVFNAHQIAEKKGIPYGVIILSTPNKTTGVGEWYYRQWIDAIENKSSFKPLKIHYSDAPFTNNEWIEKQKKILKTDAKIDQELELQFVTSESSLFDNPEVVRKLQSKEPIKKIPVTYFNNSSVKIGSGEWLIWEEFDPNKSYLIGADIATLTGACESAIEIVDSDLNQIAEFSGNLRITDFEEEIRKATKLYPLCTLIVETNSYGVRTTETIASDPDTSSLLYYTRILDKKTGKIQSMVPGLYTTSETRPMIYESIFWSVSELPERIKSEKLVLELKAINKDFKSSKLSDLVMAYGFVAYVKRYQSQYINSAMSDVSIEILEDLYGQPLQNVENKNKSLSDEIIDLIS